MLAYTPGEPAGVGPDLIVQYAQSQRDVPLVVFGSAELLKTRAELLGLSVDLVDGESATREAGQLSVRDFPLAGSLAPGHLDKDNVMGVLASLNAATDACLDGELNGLITGPMQKSVVNDAGIAFSGHTEHLAERSGVPDVVMLLVAGELRVALATTHLPLAEVSGALDKELLQRRIGILVTDLVNRFGIQNPRITVAGLNPHAGEGGHLGREEIELIQPLCERMRAEGLAIIGPLPADTMFTPKYLAETDAYLAMYHDQGLPVLKYAGFGDAVNVTLGLPFVRTSVDHGTALDIAGTGEVDAGSFEAAVDLAWRMANS